MARRKRSGKSGETEKSDEFVLQKAPEKLASPFASLKNVQLETPRPQPKPPPPVIKKREPASPSGDDIALRDAFSGVQPLSRKVGRVQGVPTERRDVRSDQHRRFGAAEAEARARLDALVSEGIRFVVDEDEDGRVLAWRERGDPQLARRLARGELAIEASLDLHGMKSGDAEQAIHRFVQHAYRQGLRTLCIVHGKGQRSEGAPVLGPSSRRALFQGRSAVLVLAAATPPERHGGLGAIIVRLVK